MYSWDRRQHKSGRMKNYVSTRIVLICVCAVLLVAAIVFYVQSSFSMSIMSQVMSSINHKEKITVFSTEAEIKRDVINNTGALPYLAEYEGLFGPKSEKASVVPDPNNPATITRFWQAAAIIDWYLSGQVRYVCKNRVAMGNWHICQDEPYTIKPPCLVYSFGINWDYSFDDAMAKLGCEVHSFDPSMNTKDNKRGNNSYFHNMGLGGANTDGYVARKDVYVKDRQVWKMRTAKGVTLELGHENRVIDVFKMDIEAYEWSVVDNMIETGMFKYIRQFILEYHLFPEFPLREEYVYIYKTQTRLREMGFREHYILRPIKKFNADKFNLQGDTEYVNFYFKQPTQ